MDQFLPLYHQLDHDTLSCLESVGLHQGKEIPVSERHLSRLLELHLLEFAYRSGWRPTWLGSGILNWHKQLQEALKRKVRAPKPRLGENGNQPGPPCHDFRELLFSGVYCWCGRLRSDHPGEAAGIAAALLAHHDRNQKLAPFHERITGRCFDQLAVSLPSDLQTFLQLVSPLGSSIHDLHYQLGQVRFLAVQASLSYLGELDLVYFNPVNLLWYPTWDGVGLKNWLQEQFVREGLKEPMLTVRFGENGQTSMARACNEFRPILSKGGGACWCGHSLQKHTG